MDNLSGRTKAVLSAIIREYISTAEPISSKCIAARSGLGLSPASIRKVMAELEATGYLAQPHTSAGRVPTEKSFRYYVDTLVEMENLMKGDMEIIRSICSGAGTVSSGVREVSRALSMLTHSAVMVSATTSDGLLIKNIRVVKIDRENLMVVIVSGHGIVRTELVRMKEQEVVKIDFEKVSNYLNSIAAGLTVDGLKVKIVKEMADERNLCDELMANALKLSAAALDKQDSTDDSVYYVEGTTNIIDQPEFRADLDKMKRVFNLFQEKSLLVKILDSCMEGSGTTVLLGSESNVKELEGLSFVTAPYVSDGDVAGTLGVIGPVWMNYPKIIPLVGYTAGLLGKGLSNLKKLN